MTEESSARTPGKQTSEYRVAKGGAWVGITVMVAGIIETFAQQSESPWAGVALAVCGLVMSSLVALGYISGRTQAKKAAAAVDAAKTHQTRTHHRVS